MFQRPPLFIGGIVVMTNDAGGESSTLIFLEESSAKFYLENFLEESSANFYYFSRLSSSGPGTGRRGPKRENSELRNSFSELRTRDENQKLLGKIFTFIILCRFKTLKNFKFLKSRNGSAINYN